MEDITNRWRKLKLTDKEASAMKLTKTLTKEHTLVGKFFTKRKLNIEAVARTLRSIWNTKKTFEVRDLRENMLQFIFKDEADLEWVIKQSPWTFDKYLVVLQKPDEDNSIESMSFNSSPFWVQLHNVPLSRMSKENAKSIGATIGEVEEVDVPVSGQGYGRFLRVRVKVKIGQPLCSRGRLVDLGGRDPIWVAFRYERLPVFCYKCGKLNHDERDCQGKSKSRGNLRSEESQYGP
ncbi:hypothetical protein SO802_006189 [Lithocarpus litseifolius]|uniref:CCHC-type domain-containing protein n=1 Tax=Lithocarpus litseifolius TaxID=425828 RepID=A0AAW2DKY9_9ROSI